MCTHCGIPTIYGTCESCRIYESRRLFDLSLLNSAEKNASNDWDDAMTSTLAHRDMPEPFIPTDGIWLDTDNDLPEEWPTDIEPWDRY